jgi:hypothetical protein
MTLRRFNSIAAILLSLACAAGSARSEQPGRSRLLYGAVVFISSPSGSNMGALLASQIARYKVPLTISSERPYASYILAAFVEPKTGTGWEAKAVLADAQTHAVAWTAEFSGPCRPCDAAPGKAEQIMAARFVKRLKKDLFSRESISDHIDDFLAP